MGAFTDYTENQIIVHNFRTSSWTKPTVIAIALYTAAPGETGGGTEVGGAGTNYARVTRNPSDTNWGAPTSTYTTANSASITFNTPGADWGTITYVGILDSAATGSGNLLYYGALTTPKTVLNGDQAPLFASGAISITLD